MAWIKTFEEHEARGLLRWVDHPRWSQARDRRIGEFGKRPTLMFHGYADQVADLYRGIDLRLNL